MGIMDKPSRAIPKAVRTVPNAVKEASTKNISLSLPTDALARLDRLVLELQALGYLRVNRDLLVVHALDKLDLDSLARTLAL